MTISYSAPPANPELNSSSPFYSTLQAYALFSGSKGLPRDIVHNAVPKRYSGPWGTAFGEDSKVVSGSFPFSPAADGSSTNYSHRFTGGSKALAYTHGGFNTNSGHGTVGVAHTLFCVFQIEEVFGWAQPVAMLIASGDSPYTNSGGGLMFRNNNGTLGNLNGLAVAASPVGSMYLAFTEDNTYEGAIYPCLQAPIVKDHWYLAAISFYKGTDTYSGSVSEPRRLYLHDLTTDTRIVGTADTTPQTWGTTYWSFGVNANRGYTGTGQLPTNHTDLIIAPGPKNNLGPFCGKIHLAGNDQQFWDNSGQFAAIPAGFSGVDPFTTLLADIYEPARGTYATGSGGTTLVNSSNQNASNGNRLSPVGLGKLAGAYSTIANVVAGVPSDLGLVFLGDAAVTKVTDTLIEITVARPQAGAAAVTSYSLYGSTTAPFTPGAGTLLATQTVASDPLAHVFRYTPPDKSLRFFVVTATDGTNTYTYPQVEAATRETAAQFIITCGNSYGTKTGGSPWQTLARAGQAWGFDTPIISVNFDGSAVSDWLAGTANKTTPFNDGVNPLGWLQAVLAREAAALGRPVDSVFCWLVENNTGTSSASFNTSMQTMAAALLGSNLSRFCPITYGARLLASTSISNPPGGPGEAVGQGLTAVDNNSTIVVLGSRWLTYSTVFAYDQSSAHPSIVQAQAEADIIMNDYATRVIYSLSKSVFVRPGMLGGFRQ